MIGDSNQTPPEYEVSRHAVKSSTLATCDESEH
jgi:hypothetical protein